MREVPICRPMNWLEQPRVRRIALSLFWITAALLVARSYYIVFQPLVSAEEFHRVTSRAAAMFPWLIGLGGYEQYGVGAKKIIYLYCLNYLPGLLLGIYFVVIDVKTLRRISEKAKKNRSILIFRVMFIFLYVAIFLLLPLYVKPLPIRNVFGNLLFLNKFTAPLSSLIFPWVTGNFVMVLSIFLFHLFFPRSK